jgi:hypothetical protein
MSMSNDPRPQWDLIAEELRSCRESQRAAWGDVDNATLGRYLAGEASEQERAAVEAAQRDHPELQVLTDLVFSVLDDKTPAVSAPEPTLLKFTQRPTRPRRSVAFRQRVALLAACLFIGVGLTALGSFNWLTTTGSPVSVDSGLASAEVNQLNELALLFEKNGPQRPATPQTERKLARLYQTALVTTDAAPTPHSSMKGHLLMKTEKDTALSDRKQPSAHHHAAQRLREHIENCTSDEVRKSVVPVLARALHEARGPEERIRLAQALGELGPAACDACPTLHGCLVSARTETERGAYKQALNQMGEFQPPTAKFVTKVDPTASSQCCVGVNDRAGCFSVRCLREAGRNVQQLARTAHREVLIESVPSLEPREIEALLDKDKSIRPTLHIIICRQPKAVRVEVSEELRKAGVDPVALQKKLEEMLHHNRSFDETLRTAVKEVAPAR